MLATTALKTSEQSKSVVFTVVATDNVGVDSVAVTGATSVPQVEIHIHYPRLIVMLIIILVKH